MLNMLSYLNERELADLAAMVVLAVGMTPVKIAPPAQVEGLSWRECYERGLGRLSEPLDLM